MTRAERTAQREATLRTRQEALARELAQAQARTRRTEREAREKRRYVVGKLVDQAGLFVWSDADLAAVVQALATLRDVPHPGGVIAGLLQGSRDPSGLGSNGMAHPADGISPSGAECERVH
jgi:hypothetical protein